MSDRDKEKDLAARLRPMIETPALRTLCANTGMTELGAQAVLDYAQEELRKAIDDSAHPIMVFMSFIAACEAAFIGANVPKAERLDMLVMHYKLLSPVVEENIEHFKPKKDGAAVTLN